MAPKGLVRWSTPQTMQAAPVGAGGTREEIQSEPVYRWLEVIQLNSLVSAFQPSRGWYEKKTKNANGRCTTCTEDHFMADS